MSALRKTPLHIPLSGSLLFLGVLLLASALISAPSFAFATISLDLSSQSDNTAQSEALSSNADQAITSEEGFLSVSLSAEGEQAVLDKSDYAASDFSRSNKGTNRAIDGIYHGYTYIQPQESMTSLIDMGSFVVVYIPNDQLKTLGLSLDDIDNQTIIKALLKTLDDNAANGNTRIDDNATWYFTDQKTCSIQGVDFSFDQRIDKRNYCFVIGANGEDLTENDSTDDISLHHASFALLVDSGQVTISQAPSSLGALVNFFEGLDWSPLWVTLKTTLTAIVIIFILGILAAWFSLRIPSKWQNFIDVVFTIPMVLPPTVCGFILLLALGSNSPVGQWFDSIGFPLIFSWQATVIAAVVVAFPLMYRSARGAFENLNSDMLDAARTLGWSERRIFFRLMLPLAWSSIAAGTMLAFARALGEFGATLFLAGNYAGITRTIPIAIYFEWMGGNTDAAIFWTIVVIILSFLVIFVINVWSKHTTRYRRKEVSHELER